MKHLPLLPLCCLTAWLVACGPSGYPPVTPKDLGALEAPVRRLVDRRISAVAEAPADARAHALLGAAYQANGLWLPAAESFAQAASLEPSEPLWPYYGARALSLMSRASEARALAERAAELDASFAPAHYMLGWMRFDEGELDGSRAAFERARTLEPQRPEPLVGLATIALDEGDAARARDLAERALELQPGARHARYALGSALIALGDTARGRVELEAGADSTVSNMPTSFGMEIVNAQVNRTEVLSRASRLASSGQAHEALKLLDQLTRDFPDDALIENNRGNTLERLGRVDEAITAFERAVELDDRLARTWSNLARLYVAAGRDSEALQAAGRALQLDDQNHEAWSIQSVVQRRAGDLPAALKSAKRSIALLPGKASYHSKLGNVYLSANQVAAAVESYQRTVELDPTTPQYQLALASAQMQLGRYEEARVALDRARALDPQVAGLSKLEAQCAAGLGR